MAAVAAEDGDAGGCAAAADVPDDDGVVDRAGGEPAVTRAPRQVKHVAVMLPQRVRASATTTTCCVARSGCTLGIAAPDTDTH